MIITVHRIDRTKDHMTLIEFADQHGFELEVHERHSGSEPIKNLAKFFAHFKGVEVRRGENILGGASGNGETIHEAIEDYTKEIENRTLVVGGYTEESRDIKAPKKLTYIRLGEFDE